jgi:hypothetical protein
MSSFITFRSTVALLVAASALSAGVAHAAERSMTGILTEKHGDRLDGTSTRPTYEVISPAGTVDLTGPQRREWVGRTVRVTDEDERRPGVQGDVRPIGVPRARVAAAPGPRTTLVLLVALSDLSQPITQEQARTAIFTGSESASALFAQQSGGLSPLTGIQRSDGDVAGPLSVAVSGSGCDEDAIADAADAAAVAGGFSVPSYQQIIYVLPRVPDCAWGGLGELPGRRAWTNGYLNTSVIAHEVGHNRGNHHASSLRCTDGSGRPVSLSSTCSSNEYGDPFDVMGLTARLMSSFHRLQNGDLPADAAQLVTTSGTYGVSSANSGSGIRLLLVPRKSPGVPVSEWYALERRSPLAPFDTFGLADPVSTGISVRLVGRVGGTDRTRLLDMSPATDSVLDAALQPEASFADPALPISLRALAGASGIEVVMPTLVDDVAPVFPGTLRVLASVGRASLSWQEATDDERLAHYEIERDGAIVGSTTALSYTDAISGPVTVSYRVYAVDAAGNRTAIGPTVARVPGAPAGGAGTGAGQATGISSGTDGRSSRGPTVGRIRSVSRAMRATRRGWVVVQRFTAAHATRMTAAVGGRRVATSNSSRLTVRFVYPYGARRRTVTVRASNARSQRSITSTWRR